MKKIIILILIVIFIGCIVRPEDYQKAEYACKKNGGVDYITIDFKNNIACNNGAVFKNDDPIFKNWKPTQELKDE